MDEQDGREHVGVGVNQDAEQDGPGTPWPPPVFPETREWISELLLQPI